MAAIPSVRTAPPPVDVTVKREEKSTIPTKVLNLEYGGRRFTVERLSNNVIFVKTKGPSSEEVKVQFKVKDSSSLTDKQIIKLITNEFETNAGQAPLKEFLAASGARTKVTVPAKAPTKTTVLVETSVNPRGKWTTTTKAVQNLGNGLVGVVGFNTNKIGTVTLAQSIPTGAPGVTLEPYVGGLLNFNNGNVVPYVGLGVSTSTKLNPNLTLGLGFNVEAAPNKDGISLDPTISAKLTQKLGGNNFASLSADFGQAGGTYKFGVGTRF